MVFTLIIFCLSFAISTLAYRETYPKDVSVSHHKVVRYGFPLAWLKETTVFLPGFTTHYEVLWLELIADVVFYIILAAGISFAATKFTGRHAGLTYEQKTIKAEIDKGNVKQENLRAHYSAKFYFAI